MKTLKYEEVHRQEYREMAEARASIEHFLVACRGEFVSMPSPGDSHPSTSI
jgi:hypothetical protein